MSDWVKRETVDPLDCSDFVAGNINETPDVIEGVAESSSETDVKNLEFLLRMIRVSKNMKAM